MKTLIVLCALLSMTAHASPLSWPKEAVKEIEKAKTVKEMTCGTTGSKAGDDLCELYRKDWATKMDFKIQRTNDAILIIKAGGLSVKLERTEKPYEFKLNDQMIDMHKYPTQERLGYAIDAVLSRKSAFWPALIDSAYAKDMKDPSDPDFMAAKTVTHSLMSLTSHWQDCKAYTKFVKDCLEKSDTIMKYLKTGTEKYMNKSRADWGKGDAKLDSLQDDLAEIDGKINAYFANARRCDCQPGQNGGVACTEKLGFGETKTEHLSEPRQSGMERCQRLLKAIGEYPQPRDLLLTKNAKDLLVKIEQKISEIKAEAPINGLDGSSSK